MWWGETVTAIVIKLNPGGRARDASPINTCR